MNADVHPTMEENLRAEKKEIGGGSTEAVQKLDSDAWAFFYKYDQMHDGYDHRIISRAAGFLEILSPIRSLSKGKLSEGGPCS